MALHPHERKKRIEKLDQKVHIVNQIANAKPKLIKVKRKLDKIKNINKEIQAANENSMNLLLGNFDFDPKEILNKRLIFDTSVLDEEIITDRIIDALNDPYLENDKYWIEHKPGTNYFTLRLENGR